MIGEPLRRLEDGRGIAIEHALGEDAPLITHYPVSAEWVCNAIRLANPDILSHRAGLAID